MGTVWSEWRRIARAPLVGLVAGALAAFSPAHAQIAPNTEILFELPPQGLAVALDEYAQISGLHIFYEARLTEGRTTAGLSGSYTNEAALDLLLLGTGLKAHMTGDHAVMLLLDQGAALDTGIEGAMADQASVLELDVLRVSETASALYGTFASFVGTEMRRALQRDAATARGRYQLRLNISIDESGGVRDFSLIETTGDAALDAAIGRVLRKLVVGKTPPAGMPQPIRATIITRAQ